MTAISIVVDTNIFVAAGFYRESHAAQIVGMVRTGDCRLLWNHETRKEIEDTVGRIPPLPADLLDEVFRAENRHHGKLDEKDFEYIPDPADRKFAALAVAADVPLISNDDHLLACGDRLPVLVLTPGKFLRLKEGDG